MEKPKGKDMRRRSSTDYFLREGHLVAKWRDHHQTHGVGGTGKEGSRLTEGHWLRHKNISQKWWQKKEGICVQVFAFPPKICNFHMFSISKMCIPLRSNFAKSVFFILIVMSPEGSAVNQNAQELEFWVQHVWTTEYTCGVWYWPRDL